MMEFKREAFLWVKDDYYKNSAYKELISKYLKVLPHIEKKKLEIQEKYFPTKKENQKFIGIHYRGTDKIEENETHEQKPKHYSYQKIYDMLVDRARELMKENAKYDIYIVVCTDENPFIDFLKVRLNKKLIYYPDAIRSQINTSGMDINFKNIPTRNHDVDLLSLTPEQLEIFGKRKKLIDNSVHLGNKNISNYRKGLDCLLECYMLENVDILYKSKGNFSLFCEYLNKNPDLESNYIHEVLDK